MCVCVTHTHTHTHSLAQYWPILEALYVTDTDAFFTHVWSQASSLSSLKTMSSECIGEFPFNAVRFICVSRLVYFVSYVRNLSEWMPRLFFRIDTHLSQHAKLTMAILSP